MGKELVKNCAKARPISFNARISPYTEEVEGEEVQKYRVFGRYTQELLDSTDTPLAMGVDSEPYSFEIKDFDSYPTKAEFIDAISKGMSKAFDDAEKEYTGGITAVSK